MHPVPAPPPAPQGARRFRFLECLGRGGFGEVYRATMTERGGVRTEVAVKVLHEDIDPASQAVIRLRDEAHVLAALRHPAILRVHDLVTLDGRVALVTEFVDGEDLTSLIRSDPTIPVRPLVDVVGQVASALAAASDATGESGAPLGLVHRDIKPHNIRVGRHGEVKLLDFGIARGSGVERAARTATDAVVGSWQYMAPEAFEGRQAPAADVFALGCVLFEGLSGTRPWQGLELRELYLLSVQPEALGQRLDDQVASLPAAVPAPLRGLVRELLAVAPEDRPTAAEVARRCEDLLESLPGPALRRWCGDRSWPSVPIRRGEFDGRELTEGERHVTPAPAPRATDLAMAVPASPPPEAPTSETLERTGSRPSTRAVAMAASGVAGLTLGGAALVAVLVGAVGLAWFLRPNPPPPAPVPIEVARPTAPAPIAPAVAPEEPPAEPVEAPAPSGPVGWVGLDGRTRVRVRLVDAGTGLVPLSATETETPAGWWTIQADFGSGWVQAGNFELGADQHKTVRCNSLMRTCDLR